MVVLGAAAMHLPIEARLIEQQLERLFHRKGARIVKANINAFRMGDAASRFAATLLAGGVAARVVACVVARIAFEPEPVGGRSVAAWCERLLRPDALALAERLFASEDDVAPDAVPAD